jgi:hypothetical protein
MHNSGLAKGQGITNGGLVGVGCVSVDVGLDSAIVGY